MFASFCTSPALLIALLGLSGLAQALPRPPPAPVSGSETHKVTMINKCGTGTPKFLSQTAKSQGSGTITGPLLGGVAWLDGFGGTCMENGLHCGSVEFTLINGGTDSRNAMCSINYSLFPDKHPYTYKMQIEYDDPICPRTGVCSGATPAQCPHAYMDLSKPEGDPSRPETMPLQCLQANVGVTITFC